MIKTPENEKLINEQAIKNGLAIGNYTQCEKILKNHYNISENITLLLKNMQFNPSTNLKNLDDTTASDSVSMEFINPENGEKLDSQLCNETPTPISIPFKKSERIKMDLYEKAAVLKGVVDLYDKESPGYKSRCLKSSEFDTGADTSINYRRTKLYQNESINCSPGCSYEGLDENKYVKCNCKTTQGELSNNSTGFDPLLAFPKFNYDIVLCYYETFTDVRIYKKYYFMIKYSIYYLKQGFNFNNKILQINFIL